MVPVTKELEVKFYLVNQGRLQEILDGLGANLMQTRIYERNLRFDKLDGTLTKNSEVLRLRQDSANHLTFKGPSEVRDGVSARTEIEITVNDFDEAQALLEALGYQVSMIYEKYRAVYQLNGTLVTLDEMPFGFFAEIEGPDGTNIQAVCNQLGLKWELRSLQSYAELFQIVKLNLKLSFRDLTFENFTGVKVDASDLALVPADST